MGEQRQPNDLAEALGSLGRLLVHNSRDWGLDRADAWLYAVLVGWDCEQAHEHDDVCENGEAIKEMAAQHKWAPGDIERVRRYRRAVRAITAAEEQRCPESSGYVGPWEIGCSLPFGHAEPHDEERLTDTRTQ